MPATVRSSEIKTPTSPIAPIGVAHERCADQTLSMRAPVGKMKLSEVTTQIQYFVVALAMGSDVRTHATRQTKDAYKM